MNYKIMKVFLLMNFIWIDLIHIAAMGIPIAVFLYRMIER